MSRTLELVLELVSRGEVEISAHAADELEADGILVREALAGLPEAEVVEDYPHFPEGPLRPGPAEGRARQPDPCPLGDPQAEDFPGRVDHRLQTAAREVVGLLEAQETLMARRHKKLVHEGDYAAEVEVTLIETDDAWSPRLSVEDAKKLDEVREALRRGDIATAGKIARVYRLMPVSA